MLSNKNCIDMYFHCGNCLQLKPEGVSPMEWARTQTGFTKEGLQVWCNRCDMNVVHIDFEEAQHPANTTGAR